MYRAYAQIAFNSSTLMSGLARFIFSPSKKTILIDSSRILIVVVQTLQYDMHNANYASSSVGWQRNMLRKWCGPLVLSL